MLSALQKFALLHSKIHGKTTVWESNFFINVIINNQCWTKKSQIASEAETDLLGKSHKLPLKTDTNPVPRSIPGKNSGRLRIPGMLSLVLRSMSFLTQQYIIILIIIKRIHWYVLSQSHTKQWPFKLRKVRL